MIACGTISKSWRAAGAMIDRETPGEGMMNPREWNPLAGSRQSDAQERRGRALVSMKGGR